MDDQRPPDQADPGAERRGSIVSAGPTTWPAETAPDGASTPPVGWVPVQATIRGAVVVAPGLVLAGIGTRVAAFLVDAFLLSMAAVAMTSASAGLIADRGVSDVVAAIAAAVLGVGYFAAFWIGPWAATPGQRLAGLRVVDEVTLDRIDIGRALLRSLLLGAAVNVVSFAAPTNRLLGAALVVWPFVLLASATFNHRNQGFHDRWTRAIVVRPAEAGSLPLTIGCFLIGLIILAAPLVIGALAGPELQRVLDQLSPPVQQP